MFAGIIVNVRIAPRIYWELWWIKIRSMPVLGVARLLDQILEALGIKSIVHLVLAERGFDAAVDVGLCGGDPRPLAGSRDAGNDQRRENADDGDNEQDFNQRERTVLSGLAWRVCRF